MNVQARFLPLSLNACHLSNQLNYLLDNLSHIPQFSLVTSLENIHQNSHNCNPRLFLHGNLLRSLIGLLLNSRPDSPLIIRHQTPLCGQHHSLEDILLLILRSDHMWSQLFSLFLCLRPVPTLYRHINQLNTQDIPQLFSRLFRPVVNQIYIQLPDRRN
eukprot:gene29869-33699_t